MPYEPAKCSNCGAVLHIDRSKGDTVCEYCGTPYTAISTIEQRSVVVIEDANSMLKKARTHDSFGEFEEAIQVLLEMSVSYPSDKRCWRELYEHARPFSPEAKKYLNKFIILSGNNDADRAFLRDVKVNIGKQIDIYEARILELQAEEAGLPQDSVLRAERDRAQQQAATESMQIEQRIEDLSVKKHQTENKLSIAENNVKKYSKNKWAHILVRGFISGYLAQIFLIPIVIALLLYTSLSTENVAVICAVLTFLVIPLTSFFYSDYSNKKKQSTLSREIGSIESSIRDLEILKTASPIAVAYKDLNGKVQRRLAINKRDLPALRDEINDLRKLRETL